MVDVIQSWLGSGQPATLNDIVVWPRRLDKLSPAPLMDIGEQAAAYYLIDEENQGWILKKFFPETQLNSVYVEAIQGLIPKRPGFESGFGRQVLQSSSASDFGYSAPEFLTWIEGAILMPQVMSPTWAEVAASIREGSAILSSVERLLLCRKLSELVGLLESLGLAHRDLSAANVMLDPLNMEVHLIDWDSLFHASLELPANATGGTRGYVAPFVTVDGVANATWQHNSDRFALTALNVELLTASAGVAFGSGIPLPDDAPDRSVRSLDALRESLRRSFPAAVEFLDAAVAARSFADCPSPAEWIDLADRELESNDQTTWEEASVQAAEVEELYTADYQPHFVKVNQSAFVRINQGAFVRAPAARWG